jgi:hypothetical protein
MLFRASKWPRKLGTRKLGKNCQIELVGIGGRKPKSIWINPPPFERNGIYFVEFHHHMRKFLLNLAPGEPLALVQELPCFDNSIKRDPLLEISLDLCVHNQINVFMLHAVRFELYWCQLFYYL